MLLITLDYESMYTNIVHEEAIEAVRKTLQNDVKHEWVDGIKRPSTKYFCQLLELTITRNTFQFDGKDYHQCRGVAMGIKCSPEVSDIVIYYLEKEMLKLANNKVLKWLRFRDDVFALFVGSKREAELFLNRANTIHRTLKFKYEISGEKGVFLDTIIFKGKRFSTEQILDFKPYIKPSEAFQYLHRTSSHPKSVFIGLIKGELIRFVRTSTNYEDFMAREDLFKEKLLLRGFSENEFQAAFNQVSHNNRNLYLEEKKKEKEQYPLVFVTPYNPHVRGLTKALNENWSQIEKCEKLKAIFKTRPMIAYKRGTLVRAKLSTEQDSGELENLIRLMQMDPDSGI